MALSATAKKLLNNISPGAKVAKLGDLVDAHEAATQPATAGTAGVVKRGVAVPDATPGAPPTAAQYLELLTSLRNAGVIAT